MCSTRSYLRCRSDQNWRWVAASAAVAAYAARSDATEDGLAHQFLRLVVALLAVTAVSALLVHGVMAFATLAVAPDSHHIAFLRTLVISAVSLCLAYAGPRMGRIAVTRMAYVALAFIAAKLLFEACATGTWNLSLRRSSCLPWP